MRGWQSLGTRARRLAVVAVLAAAAVGVLTAPGLESVRMSLADGTAWLVRGTGIAHASSSTGEADWLIPEVVDPEAAGRTRVGQEGDVTVMVDPVSGRALSVDAVTLELGEPMTVDASTVPLVGGGEAYLVSDGMIRWLDVESFETKARIRVPGRVRAAIDSHGVLWAVTPRDGKLRRIVGDEVTHQVRVTTPGNFVEVSLAGDRPVVFDVVTSELWFVDRRDAELSDPVTLPEGSVLQGPSPHGERVWAATPESVLGVAPDGDAIETRRPDGGTPHRPEVVDGRVVVPTHEGTLTVVDEASGQLVTDEPQPLPAATNEDFSTFVKDGVLWFNAPRSQVAGTVAPDGTVEVIEVDEEGLRRRQQGRPDQGDAVNPNQVVTPTAGPAPTPAPGSGGAPPRATPPTSSAPVQPAPPTPTPPPTRPPAPVTTTTTQPTTTGPQAVPVPNLVNQNVDQACAALQQQGLQCQRQPSGQYAEPAQVVLSQNPQPGASVARGTPVAVAYNESAGVIVPRAGERRGNACAPVEAAGLVCNLIPAASPNPVQPEGVYDQNPQPNTRVGPGATVNVHHDNRRWGTLYQFDNPANYELVLSTDPGARAGWNRTELGRIFLEQAPGTVPVHCTEPNGDGLNQSNRYTVDDDPDGDGYHRACAQYVLGYFVEGAWGAYSIVYGYVGHSDFYYSLSDNDPIGQAEYPGRDSAGYVSAAFHVFQS